MRQLSKPNAEETLRSSLNGTPAITLVDSDVTFPQEDDQETGSQSELLALASAPSTKDKSFHLSESSPSNSSSFPSSSQPSVSSFSSQPSTQPTYSESSSEGDGPISQVKMTVDGGIMSHTIRGTSGLLLRAMRYLYTQRYGKAIANCDEVEQRENLDNSVRVASHFYFQNL